MPEPAEAETQETEQATETPAPETAAMTDIFARLSTQTEELFKQEQTQAPARRMWGKSKHLLGLDHPGTLKYYLLFLAFAVSLVLFAVRFELVRAFPAAEKSIALWALSRGLSEKGWSFRILSTTNIPKTMSAKWK